MFPFNITPDAALQEIQDLGNKLGQGLQNLSELGEIPVGASEYDVVYSEDKLSLHHYKPLVDNPDSTPLLIVYSLVNRPYMADLQKGRSLVEGLLKKGLDVYMIDWGYPDAADRYLTLDDYINGYIDNCVDVVSERAGVDKINILGICQGGAFSLCYTSLHIEKVKNLITTVTPVDFHTKDDLLSHMVRNVDMEQLVDTVGNVSGEMLNNTFLSLKPFRLTGQKYLDMVNIMKDEKNALNFMRMEKWIFDSPDQAGEAYKQFITQFYQQNKLIKGEVMIGDDNVNLNNITVPVLNIFAKDDHLVPVAASKALEEHVGTKDYTALEFPGGHIGIYVSGKAQKMIPPTVAEWLNERS
jgi:polyhydroxyalkanoate synthase